MSTLYQCKLMSDKIITPSGSEMVSLLPVTYDWREEFLLDTREHPDSFEGFFRMVKEFIASIGPEQAPENFHDCSFFSRSSYKYLSELLHKDLAGVLKPADCYHLEGYYFGNNLLAELIPVCFKPAPLRQLVIEAITVHPDAGFPADRSTLNKSLCLRMLADLEGTESSRLYRWFEDQKPGCFYEPDFSGMGECVYAVIAGAKRIETIDMQVENQEFWERYADRWWAERLRRELRRPSDNKPYRALTFLIHLHPSWLGEKLPAEPFDSVAYAVPY